jgi:DNA gyrase/topoisomerase IV subunit A
MDPRERRDAEHQLAALEVLLRAYEHRHEVVDIAWESSNEDEAGERLRGLLGIDDGRTSPGIVLEVQMSRFTRESRDAMAATVAHLRNLLGRE